MLKISWMQQDTLKMDIRNEVMRLKLSEDLSMILALNKSKSPIEYISKLIETKYPNLDQELPETYKDYLRMKVAENEFVHTYDGINSLTLQGDYPDIRENSEYFNPDAVELRISPYIPRAISEKLIESENVYRIMGGLTFMIKYHSIPVKASLFVDSENTSNFNLLLDFPVYAFKNCLENEGFKLECTSKFNELLGSTYKLTWK